MTSELESGVAQSVYGLVRRRRRSVAVGAYGEESDASPGARADEALRSACTGACAGHSDSVDRRTD